MENIIIVSFDIESEGYQAITELKKNVLKDGYAVSQAVLVKNTDGHVTSLDSFDTGIEAYYLMKLWQFLTVSQIKCCYLTKHYRSFTGRPQKKWLSFST